MVPIRKKENVLGLLEAFASEAGHFRQHDVATLESFCKQIVNEIDHSIAASAVSKLPVSSAADSDDTKLPTVNARRFWAKLRLADRWTLLLTSAVIATALFLGWVLGRTDKRPVSNPNLARSDPKHVPRLGKDLPDNKRVENGISVNSATSAKAVSPQTFSQQTDVGKPQVEKIAPGLSESKNLTPAKSGGGLVVYQNGRVLFRENARQGGKPNQDGTGSPEEQPSRVVPAGKTTLLTSDAANDYLTYRVEPQYPELARQERIQGPVLLKVMVGKDGGVQQVQVLRGDPKLAAAASSAVVQWQFKPFLRAGRPVEFETQITVDFKLP